MCYYLVATLPSDADLIALEPLIERYNMGFEVLENKYLSNQLSKGERLFIATKNYCDCDTVIGCDVKQTGEMELGEHRLVLSDDEKQGRELKNWFDFIYEALKGNKASHLGIIKHFYRGSVEQEKFKVLETTMARIKGIKPKYLRKVQDDVYYKFIP